MDYAKLLKPYAAPSQPGGPERTPEGQRTWLLDRHRMPADLVDLAMARVYADLATGRTYPDGHDLDRAMLAECVRLAKERSHAALDTGRRQIEDAANNLNLQRRLAARPRNLIRHPLAAAKWYVDSLGYFGAGLLIGTMLGWWLHGG